MAMETFEKKFMLTKCRERIVLKECDIFDGRMKREMRFMDLKMAVTN